MRDPRVEPIAGDVLRKRRFVRGVSLLIYPRTIRYWRRRDERPTANYFNNCTIGGWRRWAKEAEVLHTADQERA